MLFTAINEFFFHIYPDVNVILISTALKDAYGNSVKAVIMGTFSLWIGSMIGQTLNAHLIRHLFKKKIRGNKLEYRNFYSIDKVGEQQGFKYLILARLSPNFFINKFLIQQIALSGITLE